jgi:hypothetical protein
MHDPSRPGRESAKKTVLRRCAYGLVGLVLALVFWKNFPWFADPAFGFTADFTKIFDGIKATGHFTRQLPNGRFIPETLREPLYPYALYAADEIFGYYTRLVYFQEMLLVATCLTWIFAAWRWLGFIWALGLAGLIFFNQPLFLYAAILYPYAFNVFFLSTALFFTARLLFRRQLRWAILAGLLFGLAAYERGSLALLPLFLGICFLGLPKLVSRKAVGALVLTYLLCVSPWLLRNASYGITGMHGMMGQILGYTYGDVVLSESDRTAAAPDPDPYGLRPEYIDHLRRERADAGTWAFLHSLEDRGLSTAAINRIIIFYVKQAVRHQPGAAAEIVLQNLAWFPCRLVQIRIPQDNPWLYYQSNVAAADPSRSDYLVLAGCLLGLGLMICNREPILAVFLPVMFYLVAVNLPLVIFDPRYRNGVFDILMFFSLLYALNFFYCAVFKRNWRLSRIGSGQARGSDSLPE